MYDKQHGVGSGGNIVAICNRRWVVPSVLFLVSGCNAVEDREAVDTDVPDVVSTLAMRHPAQSAVEDGYDAQDALDDEQILDQRQYSHRAIGGYRWALQRQDSRHQTYSMLAEHSVMFHYSMVSAGLRLQLGGFE